MRKLTITILIMTLVILIFAGCEKGDVVTKLDKLKDKLLNDETVVESMDTIKATKEYYRKKELLCRINHFEMMQEFKNVVEDSKRINVLILGTEVEGRADTIFVASIDTKTKKTNLISIPRDTYFHRLGHDTGDHRKINAAYPRGGYEDIIGAVESILNIPVHNYVKVRYSGVEAIVNMLGGVEVDVPFYMELERGYLEEGRQTLDGQHALDFLRYRKGYNNGDLGRIQAQQQFIKSALRKTLNFNLVKVIPTALKYVKHDLNIIDITKYAKAAVGIKMNDISITTLPGSAGYKRVGGRNWSYFIPDNNAIKDLIFEMYEFKPSME